MALFKMAATDMLLWLCIVFAIGNVNRGARGSNLYLLFLGTLAAAALLLLAVRMAASAAVAASLPPGADAVARAAAEAKGLSSVASRWKRTSLRGMFLLAVGLSTAAAFLAIDLLEGQYAVSASARWSMAAVLMLIVALIHGFFAWVAVCED